MYLRTDEFMRPVFQGIKQVGEPAVHVLAKSKKGMRNTHEPNFPQIMAMTFTLKFNSKIQI